MYETFIEPNRWVRLPRLPFRRYLWNETGWSRNDSFVKYFFVLKELVSKEISK